MKEHAQPSVQHVPTSHETGLPAAEGILGLFGRYAQVDYVPLPGIQQIADLPSARTVCLFESEDGQNTAFRDAETITYFYDLSGENLDRLTAARGSTRHSILEAGQHISAPSLESDGILIRMVRGNSDASVGAVLQSLLEDNKPVTHIVRAEEIYGGNTQSSTWREYSSASIYEAGEGQFRW